MRNTISQVCFILLDAIATLVTVRCIFSFVIMLFNNDITHKIYNALQIITDPILLPFRKLLELIPGVQNLRVDFSPILALIVISILQCLL